MAERYSPRPSFSGLMSAIVAAFLVCLAGPASAGSAGQYMSLDAFLAKAFALEEAAGVDAPAPAAKVYWLSADLKQQIRQLSGRDFPLLRVRYWQQADRTAWVLDEIGKEMPITVGVVVEKQKIVSLDILTFRESRGWEVRHPFFTRQFEGAGLTDKLLLNERIDGITGATLSVRAVTWVARLALLFDAEVNPASTGSSAP